MDADKHLLLCDCEGTMTLDAPKIASALGLKNARKVTGLCMGDLDVAAGAIASSDNVIIACGQQARLFAELADEIKQETGHDVDLLTVDIRDRAGWTDGGNAAPKQAALLAEAMMPRPSTPVRDVESTGTCLIIGTADTTIPVARRLAETLAVTLLLTDSPTDLTPEDGFDIALGRLKSAKGALGGFEVVVDGFAPMIPAGRGAARFEAPKNGAKSGCDILIDLTGAPSLFPAAHKREGYLRAAPNDSVALERVIFNASQLIGTFEKPLYIRFEPSLCAHSRARQTGCDRCLNVCPTGAITTAGDVVSIDPMICAGCGACAAVCPSGAASYDDPPVETLFARLRVLAQTYTAAGGTAPRVLFHDPEFGTEIIALSARFGRGLPVDVIPVEVANVEGIGHAEILAAFGNGFSAAIVLQGPQSDLSALGPQMDLTQAMLQGLGHEASRAMLIAPQSPDDLEAALYAAAPDAIAMTPILTVGGRRDVTRLAATALAGGATPTIPLPVGSPYGSVSINASSCTMCLACVSLCPVGALGDNPDRPEVNFREDACLQCGICAATCPEDAITLTPQLDLSKEVLSPRVLNTEDPFECIECGTPFGVKSTIERIVTKLSGNHWMYTNSDNARLIQMCDNCRIKAQYHDANSPFRGGDRPKIRTSDD